MYLRLLIVLACTSLLTVLPKPMAAGSDYSAAVISQTKPVLYWELDETASPAKDSVGRVPGGAHNGVFENVTFGAKGPRPTDGLARMGSGNRAPGVHGPGAVRYSQLKTAARVPADKYSIQCWFKSSVPLDSAGVHSVLGRGNGTRFMDDARDTVGVGGTDSRTAEGKVYFYEPVSAVFANGKTRLRSNAWHHLVLVRDGKRVQVFVNGNLEIAAEAAWGGGDGEHLTVGNRADCSPACAYGLVGMVDEAAVWDRPLSVAEAKELYELAGPEPGRLQPKPLPPRKIVTPATPLRRQPNEKDLTIGNPFLTLKFRLKEGRLEPESMVNHVTGEVISLVHSDGFALHRGEPDPNEPKEAVRLADFALTDFRRGDRTVGFDLESHRHQIACRWQFELPADGPYVRSQLEVKNIGADPLEISDVDLLVLRLGPVSGAPGIAEIPETRSGAVGDGDGVALAAGQSVFAMLEALLYDYRLGVSKDGQGFRVGHSPGWLLQPGATATTKRAVLGVGKKGEAGRWLVEKYLTPNWRQTRQGNPQWDRYWAYNITFDEFWSLGTPEMLTLAKALGKAREAYAFGFRYVGPDISTYKGWKLNEGVFPDGEKGFQKVVAAIEAAGSRVEGYYGVGAPEFMRTAETRTQYRDALGDLVDRHHLKMLVFDGFFGGNGGQNPYVREQVWDNFCQTIETLQAKHPDLMIGLESFSPNLLSRWLWVNTQFDHHASHYLKYNPDAKLNNVGCELIPDAGAGTFPLLHSRDANTGSSGVYELYGVPWRGAETFGPLWQLVYNSFYQGSAAMERSRDQWVLNLFGAATAVSPVTYGRIFGQPPEDLAWLGRMLKLRDANLDVLAECTPKENGDIFHCKGDRGFAVFRHLRWESTEEKAFTLDASIGLTGRQQDYLVRQLYPTERVLSKADGQWRWKPGDRVTLRMNPFELRLVSIEPAAALQEPIVLGCDYERCAGGKITLLGLPGERCRTEEVGPGGTPGKTEEVAFEGTKNDGSWYARLAALRAIPDAERSAKRAELLARVDFVKAAGFPAAWRSANLYGLLEYHRQHPYPHPEIEAAREIKMEVVHASKRWFCDDDPATPPSQGVLATPGLGGPFNVGVGVTQADLGAVRPVGRLRVAVRAAPAELAASLSADGHAWTRVKLATDGKSWDSGAIEIPARYLRLESDALAVYEFQVSLKGPDGRLQPVDWSKIEPYPLSFVRSLTRPEDAAHAWSATFRLPRPAYDGQELAVPVWLQQAALVSELWPLYRVGGEERTAYRAVPGYAKEGRGGFGAARASGVTFKLPLSVADAGKEVEVIVVSAQPVQSGDVWLVSDPLPYVRKPWPRHAASRQASAAKAEVRPRRPIGKPLTNDITGKVYPPSRTAPPISLE